MRTVEKIVLVLCSLSLLTVGIIHVCQIINNPLQIPDFSVNRTQVFSENEEAIRRLALEKLHNVSSQRQKEIHEEGEVIVKKMHSDEFFYMDNGIRFKVLQNWDYDYWLAENTSEYYEYYLTDGLYKSTIFGFAQGASFEKIKTFVGSLRNTGFSGRIVVSIDANSDKNTINYLQIHGVDINYLDQTACSHQWATSQELCIHPYSNIISEWSRVPLIRDYLLDCFRKNECTDQVLVTDVSKTLFQRDPFGPGARFVRKLELFEENPHIDVKNSMVRERIFTCTGWDIRNRPMISANVFAGPIELIISFLDQVYEVIREWMMKQNCHSQYHRDDDLKAIFNFMRLSDSVPVNVTYYSHRTGIVNNVGYEGKRILISHLHFQQFRGFSSIEAMTVPFEGANGSRWIADDYLLIDEEGFFVNLNFQRSYIVYDYDAFGAPYLSWLEKNTNITSIQN